MGEFRGRTGRNGRNGLRRLTGGSVGILDEDGEE